MIIAITPIEAINSMTVKPDAKSLRADEEGDFFMFWRGGRLNRVQGNGR